MTTVETDLRTRSARRLPSAPTAGLVATNVQSALEELARGVLGTLTTVTSTPYTLLPTDAGVAVNVPSAATVNLGTVVGRSASDVVIIDTSGLAGTNLISIFPAAGETIDAIYTSVNPLQITNNYGGFRLKPVTGGWIISP